MFGMCVLLRAFEFLWFIFFFEVLLLLWLLFATLLCVVILVIIMSISGTINCMVVDVAPYKLGFGGKNFLFRVVKKGASW